MLGSESEGIPDKGKRARIAQRSAFLLATKGTKREEVYTDMSDYIKKRNELAHGSQLDLSQWETEKFGKYARRILTRLLLVDPPFKDMNDLDKWILQKSFQG